MPNTDIMLTDICHLTLKGGRRLAYSEWGDSVGFPVFYFHGTPSCQFEAAFAAEAAKHHGFRLIATDRPGFGQSDFQKGRRFADWPEDILALADHLGIGQFGVAGHSGAGPHLFACGVFIAPERLQFIGALGPWGPVATPEIAANLNRLDRAFMRLARRFPWIMQVGFAPMGWAARYWPRLFLGLMKRSVSAPDQKVLANSVVAKQFEIVEREAFRQGSRGPAHEAMIAYTDWGFDIADVRVPSFIWQGTDDIFVTNAMGRYIEKAVPNTAYYWVEGAGHLNFHNWDDILGACRDRLDESG